MTVREFLAELQRLPRDAEVLAFEAGCEEYCEGEVDEVEWRAAGCTCISVPGETTRNAASRPGFGVRGRALVVAVHPLLDQQAGAVAKGPHQQHRRSRVTTLTNSSGWAWLETR